MEFSFITGNFFQVQFIARYLSPALIVCFIILWSLVCNSMCIHVYKFIYILQKVEVEVEKLKLYLYLHISIKSQIIGVILFVSIKRLKLPKFVSNSLATINDFEFTIFFYCN